MLYARHNAAILAVELPKRGPLSQSAYAVLYPEPHDHNQKITFYYSVRFTGGMLNSIVLDDLTGNGDNSRWCNLGYGSILVSSVLALIYDAYPSQGPVSVSGRMSDAGDTSAASNERRRHFWKKMGLKISSSDDESLSGVLGENGLGTLPAIAAENWYDTDVQQVTHFTESDIEVVETLWARLLKDGWKALCDEQSEENHYNEQTQRTNSRNWNLLVLGGSVVGCSIGWWWIGTLSVALGATIVGGGLGYHAYMRWLPNRPSFHHSAQYHALNEKILSEIHRIEHQQCGALYRYLHAKGRSDLVEELSLNWGKAPLTNFSSERFVVKYLRTLATVTSSD